MTFDLARNGVAPRTLEPGETGRVRSTGALAVVAGPAVTMAVDARLYVNGSIEVAGGESVFGEGAGLKLATREGGSIHAPYTYAVYFRDARGFSITNEGVLSGGESGIFLSAATSGAIVNAGEITGAVAVDTHHQWSETLTVENTGRIVGALVGLRQSGGALHLANHGTIATTGKGRDAAAVIATDDPDIITNFGRLRGKVELGGGDNRFDGRGGVQDAVIGGSGDDRIYGGGWADEIYGGSGGDDRLYGSGDRDVIFSGKGAGADRLYGGAGSDRLTGGAGADALYGGSGNDVLVAGPGGAILSGGANGDRLVAGDGRDQLIGGDGSDRFVFADSAAAGRGAGRDTIRDFTANQDVIDLSDNWGSRAFEFIGGDPFSGSRLELRYDRATGRVQGDTTGNGRENFSLQIEGAPRLDADDFIL